MVLTYFKSRIDKHYLVQKNRQKLLNNNFGTNRYLDEICCGWSPWFWNRMMMKKWLWQHYKISHAHLTEASPGFKHYTKKLGRHHDSQKSIFVIIFIYYFHFFTKNIFKFFTFDRFPSSPIRFPWISPKENEFLLAIM